MTASESGGIEMTSRLIVVAFCALVFVPPVVVGQTPRVPRANAAAEAPPNLPPQAFADTSQTNEVIERLLAIQPAIPLGPVDVLKSYENEMAMIAHRLSAELTSISQAHRANQIMGDRAEYLIQNRYQVALMDFDVLSALHDGLEEDIARAAKLPASFGEPDKGIVAQPTSSMDVRTQ
jgi:hypothetical protein